MFGLEFLFGAGLWALPLAGTPVLLHLLFRQKSPVVLFSTLRFVKLSVQQTAVRRRVQKWLLLACRAILVAMLIWAIAQPAKKLVGNWGNGGQSAVAVIVVDCSYSMLLQEAQVSLLDRADGMVQELLRGRLANAKVAVFRNQPGQRGEEIREGSAVLAEWSPLKAEASSTPLAERAAAAMSLLQREVADQKWLIVISDFQTKEFGRPLPSVKGVQTVLMDVHPAEARSAGITAVTISPQQPIPGIGSEAVVEVIGHPGDSRAVVVECHTINGKAISQTPTAMANLDAGGRAVVRFPIKLPAERWVMIRGTLTADDAMTWDNERSELVEIPPVQKVTILQGPTETAAERFVRLALDPSEGKRAEWPLAVSGAEKPSGQEGTAVAVLSQWPDAQRATALRDLARSGRSVLLFLEPGLEESWDAAPAEVKEAMAELLPSAPVNRVGRTTAASSHVVVADRADPLLEGLTDEKYQLSAISVRRLVPLAARGNSAVILNAAPTDPLPGSRIQGLVFRKPVGAGICFTVATSPESRFTNLATHPTFLPLVVRMALRTMEQSNAQNVELGQPLVLNATTVGGDSEVQIEGPGQAQYRVKASQGKDGRQFVFAEAREQGVYQWRHAGDGKVIAITNVQLPASESELVYREAKSVSPGEDTVVASSVGELEGRIDKLSEPEPRWSGAIAIVMMLLCLEALIGSGVFNREGAKEPGGKNH